MNKEEKLINVYESDEYKEAVRKEMFGLLSFKKEEQFDAYIDVLMVILRNHIKKVLDDVEENYISKEEIREKIEENKIELNSSIYDSVGGFYINKKLDELLEELKI